MSCRNTLNINAIGTNSFLTVGRTTRTRRKGGNYLPTGSVSKTDLLNHVWNPRKKKNAYHNSFIPYAGFLHLPLLPFPPHQVLVPSESKTLHLYEARYLKLLDESLNKKKKLFVHFVLDPIVVSSMSTEASFAARYACLVFIEKVEQLDVGALVSIRGIGRVTLVKFEKADPFLEGMVMPLQDNVPENAGEISSKILELKETLQILNRLEIKLKTAKEEPLQTQTANSLEWALKESCLDGEEAFIPSSAERLSFSALQNVSGSTQSEFLKLQEEKLKAMDVKETVERLDNALKFTKNTISMVAAKLSIQSLNMQ